MRVNYNEGSPNRYSYRLGDIGMGRGRQTCCLPARHFALALTQTLGFGQLCCDFGRHAFTRARTLSTHLEALLYHLIVSRHLFAVLPTLLAQIGTYAAYPVVKR